jgi:hypothetical protein
MKFKADNKLGMWICNVLMARQDVTDNEKTFVTTVQRQILADPLNFLPATETIAEVLKIWWRGKKQPAARIKPSAGRIKVDVEEDSYVRGIKATCSRCGFEVEVFGTSDRSAKRGAMMLRQGCPNGENNYYDVSGWKTKQTEA